MHAASRAGFNGLNQRLIPFGHFQMYLLNTHIVRIGSSRQLHDGSHAKMVEIRTCIRLRSARSCISRQRGEARIQLGKVTKAAGHSFEAHRLIKPLFG